SKSLLNAQSDGSVVLARPIQLVTQQNIVGAGAESVYIAAFPGLGGGTAGVDSRISLWAFDLDMFIPLADNGTIQLDFLFGYKHAEMHEQLAVGNSFNSNVGQFFNAQIVPPGFMT